MIPISDNKRIVKNTIILYFRMLLTMGVSLYTVRAVLEILGVVDYGIYNVVGGFVSMLSFINNSMAGATQHFLSFEIGRKSEIGFSQVFTLSSFAYLGIALFVIFVSETFGLWFLSNELSIPIERLAATNWVYQSVIIIFVLTIFQSPFVAAIYSNEKMTIYAYIAILESLGKLVTVVILSWISYDKLISYSILLLLIQMVTTFIYVYFCLKHFRGCHYMRYWNKAKFLEILSYSGWSLMGTFAGSMKSQGVNVILNIFFGTVINAARGIASQVQAAVNGLRINFYNAVAPQITKLYSSGAKEKMLELVCNSSRLAFYLILFLSIPLLYKTDIVLNLWLNEVPAYTILFTRLVIIELMLEVMNYPLDNSILATGKIKHFQQIISWLQLMILPLSYIALSLSPNPLYPFYISIAVSSVGIIPRLFFVNRYLGLNILLYIRKVVFPCARVLMLVSVAPIIHCYFFDNNGFIWLIISLIILLIWIALCIYGVGLSDSEKIICKNKLLQLLNR